VLEYIIQSSTYLSIEYYFCFSVLVFVFILSSEKPSKTFNNKASVGFRRGVAARTVDPTRSSKTPTHKSQDKYGVRYLRSIKEREDAPCARMTQKSGMVSNFFRLGG
jgi:hypothetical protein